MVAHKVKFSIFAAVAAVSIADPAVAETLPVSAVYAAEQDAPSEYRTLLVERFDGNEGAKFALELRSAISRAQIDGESYFDVRRASVAGEPDGSTAWLSGTAFSEVERLPAGTTEETKCVRKDGDGKCIQRRTFTYSCRELAVRFTGEVQMLDYRDEIVYDRAFTTSASKRYCSNDSTTPSVSDMVTGIVNRLAWEVRTDLAPVQRHEDIRVLESRKDFEKALRKPFKKALKLTKSDWGEACAQFDRLNGLKPANVTLTFNAGLCREVVGDLDAAEELYLRTLDLEPGKDYAAAGLARIASRRRAESQLAVHFAEPEGDFYASADMEERAPDSPASGAGQD